MRLSSGCWTFLGLEREWVTALAQTPWGLFAGTHDHGVFRLNGITWQPLGLDHAIVSSLLFVPGPSPRLLAGVMPYSDEQTNAAVFATDDTGRTWMPSDGGLAVRNGLRAWAYSLETDPDSTGLVYMGLGWPVLRSQDGGRTWAYVWQGESQQLGNGVNAIAVSPSRDGHVWAAGETSIFTAYVLRSSDWGNTWAFTDPTPRFENAVQALAADSSSASRVWAGLSGVFGGVVKSDDLGATWSYSLRPRGAGWVYALQSASRMLYAITTENVRQSGSLTLMDLGVYATRNGGNTWDTLTVPGGVGGGQAAASDPQGRVFIGLRAGTEAGGVWRLER